MALLTKEQILNNNNKVRTQEVEVWGGTVLVAAMSAKAKDMFERMVTSTTGINTENIRAKLVAATVVDGEGNLMFTEKDIEELGKLSCHDLDKIVSVAQELNVISDEDVNKLAKNS